MELLLAEADEAESEARYPQMIAAAARALEGAEQLDDPALMIRALQLEGQARQLMGENEEALTCFTRGLAIGGDAALQERLTGEATEKAMFRCRLMWVESARHLPEISTDRLLAVVDDAEHWCRATGRLDWLSGVLVTRSIIFTQTRRSSEAVDAARAALTARRGSTLYTRSGHLRVLGLALCDAERFDEATSCLHEVLDSLDVSDFEISAANLGLSRCAIGRGDVAAGQRYARAAVDLAESIGGNLLAQALLQLAAASRKANHLDDAAAAADRSLRVAGRLTSRYRMFQAAFGVVETAVMRADVDTATALLPELRDLAAQLDSSDGITARTAEVAELAAKLDQLQA